MKSQLIAFAFLSLTRAIIIQKSDFEDGTLVIRTPGEYTFSEDIIFSPRLPELSDFDPNDLAEPEFFMFPTDEQRETNGRAFNLGFFAAIIVATDNVVIDLNGFSLSQSYIHSAMQRFFALIELSTAPFPSGKGPADFTSANDFRPANNVTIKNGKISGSIHHGVHGNGCKNILFENLVVSEFEVAGISLNSADNVVFRDVTVENSRRDERYNGRISQVIFSLQALSLYIEPTIPLSTFSLAVQQDIESAREELRQILREVIAFEVNMEVNSLNGDIESVNSELSALNPLIRTQTEGLPDGSLLTGILMHGTVNTGDFKDAFPVDGADNIVFENVVIRNLVTRPNELTGFSKNGKQLKDIVGAAVDIDSVRDLSSDELSYKPNAVVELQVLLSQLSLEAERIVQPTDENADALALLRRSGVPEEFLAWREGSITWDELISDEEVEIFPNVDFMFHFNKGVIGIKLDQAANVLMENVQIESLENVATEADRSFFYKNLPLAGSTTDDFNRDSYRISERACFGFGVRGVALSANVNVKGDVTVSSLFSTFELQAKAVDYINVNEDITLEVLSTDNVCTDTPKLGGLLEQFETILPYISRDEFNIVGNEVGDESSEEGFTGLEVGLLVMLTVLLALFAITGLFMFKKLSKQPTDKIISEKGDITRATL